MLGGCGHSLVTFTQFQEFQKFSHGKDLIAMPFHPGMGQVIMGNLGKPSLDVLEEQSVTLMQ